MKCTAQKNSDIIREIEDDSKKYGKVSSIANLIFRHQINALKLIIKEGYKFNNKGTGEEMDGEIMTCKATLPCDHEVFGFKIEDTKYSYIVVLEDYEKRIIKNSYHNDYINTTPEEVLGKDTVYKCPKCKKEYTGDEII